MVLWTLFGASAVWAAACSTQDQPTGTGVSRPVSGPTAMGSAVPGATTQASAPGAVGANAPKANGVAGQGGLPMGGGSGGSGAPVGAGPVGTSAMVPSNGGPPASSGTGGSVSVPLTPKGKLCLQPGNGNYTSPGPYQVGKMNIDLGMIEATQHTGKYTIYYPMPLETNCLHPIVAWGNGTGVTDSDFTYDFLNSNAASWGMVVAASSEDNTGSGNFHKAGIDYLLKQNMDPMSMFYNKLSTRAGVSGHSQGGFGASVGASHPNVVTAAIEGATMGSSAKVSVLVMTGTMDIVSGAEGLVNGAQGPMFVADWEGGNHVGTETVLGYIGLDTTSNDAANSQKGAQQFQRLYAAWFRCFLADDDVACRMFSGGAPGNCGICKDPGWHGLASANM